MKKLVLLQLFIGLGVLLYSALSPTHPFLQIDLEALLIRSPTQPQCFSSLQSLSVDIKNQGTDSLDFSLFPANISLEIGGPHSQNYDTTLTSGVLPPGAIRSIVLTDSVDFTMPGLYQLELITAVSGDVNEANDTTRSAVISIPLVSTPIAESFDSFVNDGNFAGNGTGIANGFLNEPLGPSNEFNWSVRDGMTGSASTGPDGDHSSGNGSYLYVESSLGISGDTALLISPCLDLTSSLNPGLRFFYHMFGRGIGRLEVVIRRGSIETQIFAVNGQQQLLGSEPWKGETLDLSAFASDTVQVVFRAIRGTTSTGDIALDDVEIIELPAIDLGLVDILLPEDFFCIGVQGLEVELVNEGLSLLDFSTSMANLSLEISGANSGTFAMQIDTGTLATGASQGFMLLDSIDFPNPGVNNLSLSLSLGGDGNSINDTLNAQVNSLPIYIAPYFEDFDDFVDDGNVAGNGSGLGEDWINVPSGPSDRYNWSVRSGPTGSNNTGPVGDAGTGAGSYVYTEASLGFAGDSTLLMSPCIDLSGLSFPQLRFFYHMFGSATGTLAVDILHKGQETHVFSLSGSQQNASHDPFEEISIDISSFAGDTIQVLFRGIKGGGTAGDIAIDDVAVVEKLAIDAAIRAIQDPAENICADSSRNLQVEIKNEGREDLDFSIHNATLQINLRGANTASYAIPLLNNILPVDSSLSLQVSPSANFSQAGTTEIEAIISISGQGAQSNDTLISSTEVIPVFMAPFLETFDSFLSDSNEVGNGTRIINGWTNNPQGPTSRYNWSVRRGPTGSSLTGPDTDHTLGTLNGSYLYTESSSPGEQTSILSPCLDISSLNHPALRFWYHMFGGEMGTLDAYVISGENEQLITSISGQQQMRGSDPWQEAFFILPSGIEDTIQLKFVGSQPNALGSFSSDISLDDVEVVEVPDRDLALVAISPMDTLCMDDSVLLSIHLKNLGMASIDFTQDFVTLDLTINGAINQTFSEQINRNNLAFNEQLTVEFLVDFSALGTYQLEASVQAFPGDTHQLNDTLRTVIEAVPTIQTFPYTEDFESGAGGWKAGGTHTSWSLGMPSGAVIDTAASGENAWVTNLTGPYSAEENSYVESPCFDLRGMQGAWVFLQIWYETEFSWDGAVLQSSLDMGRTWQNVGEFRGSNNWFNDTTISANPGGQGTGWTGRGTRGSGEWIEAGYPLSSALTSQNGVKFRIAFGSDKSVQDEGFAFDDFTISIPQAMLDLGEGDTLCVGSILDAGPAQSYRWSTGDTSRTISFDQLTEAIEDSLFTVTITDRGGIIATDSIRISVASGLPLVSFDFRIQGGEVEFQNTSEGDFLSYVWDFGDGTSSTEPNTNHFYGVNGDFLVTLSAENVCGEDRVQDTIRMTTTSVGEDMRAEIKLFPNPSSGMLEWEWEGGELSDVKLTVLSLMGKEVWVEKIGDIQGQAKRVIELPSEIGTGIYLLKVEADKGKVFLKFELK